MYSVVEIFQSLQGEGRFVGYPVNFIRLAGCSMGCKFCDTDIKEREALTAGQILARLNRKYGFIVVITGGEPFEHDLSPLTSKLLYPGRFSIHVETNGAKEYPPGTYTDWLSLSPKKNKPPLERNFDLADEVKWLVPLWSLEEILHYMKRFVSPIHYVQPVNDRLKINRKALQTCLEYIARSEGRLKLSVQLHKLIGVR